MQSLEHTGPVFVCRTTGFDSEVPGGVCRTANICRNFITHTLPELREACAVAQEHIITPLHVVLWTKAHNSSYIHYNTPSKTHEGGFRLCVVIDFTLDTELSSTSIVNNLLEVFCSGLAV